MISIIIPAYNNATLTLNCLMDLTKTHSIDYEIVVVNDGSTDSIYKVLHKLYPNIRVLHNESNLGFIQSVNRGIQGSSGDCVCLLNNDVRIDDPLWLRKMYDGMSRRGLDMCGLAGGNLDRNYNYIPGETTTETGAFNYLPFWCCLIARSVIDAVGLLDERFGSGFFDDVDFCYRAKKKGFKQGIISGVRVRHLYHQTFKQVGINITAQYQQNRKIFLKKMGIE